MQDKLTTVTIALGVSALVSLLFAFFARVAPSYNQGLYAGVKIGQEEQAKIIQSEIDNQQVEGIFTPTTSGQWYLRTR